jgi:hypothetical protein
MRKSSWKFKTSLAVYLFVFTSYSFAQQGQVSINQDHDITRLLNIKKQLNKTENSSDRYKIQIFSGKSIKAYKTLNEFKRLFSDWRVIDAFEEPNYKIWVGNFRTRLEADRALKRIKRKFPSAFIFKPKKEKNN